MLELADLGAESRLLLGEVVAVLEHGVGRGHAVVHRVAEDEQELWASTHTQVRESRGRAACLGARVTGGVTRWCRVVARWGEVHGGWRTLGVGTRYLARTEYSSFQTKIRLVRNRYMMVTEYSDPPNLPGSPYASYRMVGVIRGN